MIDLDNPDTWPNDNAALSKMADDGVVESTETAEPAPKEPEASPPAAEAAKPVDEGDKAPAADAKPAADPVLLTADGAHQIPYSVLKDTREQLRAATAELDALRAAQAQQPATAPVTPVVPANDPIPADVQARLDALKENWGEDIYQQAKETHLQARQLARQEAEIAALKQVIAEQKQRETLSEQDQIADAIAANDKMRAWAGSEDKTWLDRATEVHKVLLATDPTYARANWFDRFNRLPSRVEALYGVAQPVAETAVQIAERVVTKAASAAPKSLSELAGSVPAERSETEKLGDMSPGEIHARMDKLAKDPAALERYLLSIS